MRFHGNVKTMNELPKKPRSKNQAGVIRLQAMFSNPYNRKNSNTYFP